MVDDASQDGTLEQVRAISDRRLRVVANPHNLGNAANRSRAIRLAEGEFVKFVDQDDWIAPVCLAEHVRVMDTAPHVGLTCSRRAIHLEGPETPEVAAWLARYRDLHGPLGPLGEVNSGTELLARQIAAGPFENFLGEPSSMMIRRAVLERSALFNRRLAQMLDVDLWIRLMAFADVGFLDAELATRSLSPATASEANRARHRHWLDGLWLLEGLSEFPEIWRRFPRLAELRRTERRSLLVATATGRFRTQRLRDALGDDLGYGGFLLRRLTGRCNSLFDRL